MKKIIYLTQCVVFAILIAAASNFAQRPPNNIISGFVFDAADRAPISDIYVELQTDYYSTIRRIKTDSSGRYFFNGMPGGEYKVKVLPYATNYLEETQDVSILNYEIGNTVTSDSVYLDIYLKLDPRKAGTVETGTAEAIFVQEIPSEARNLFKKGQALLGKPKTEQAGFENLKKAIEIYPEYYEALYRIGLEHVKRKQYFESLPYLVKAIGVNQRSFNGFYLLGLAAYNLKQLKEAAEAFRAATVIAPQSIKAFWQYGMVLRIDGNYKDAEQALLKAQSLSKEASFPQISWQLALLYEKLQKYSEAADELEKYIKLLPKEEDTKQIKELIIKLRAKAKK